MVGYFNACSGRTGLKPEKNAENSDLESISSRQSSRSRPRRKYQTDLDLLMQHFFLILVVIYCMVRLPINMFIIARVYAFSAPQQQSPL